MIFSFSIRLTFLATLLLSAVPVTHGQESKEASEETQKQDDPFKVPEGTTKDLFEFIDKVKQTPPEERTRDAIIAHIQSQVKAVNEALARIEKQDPDDETQIRILSERLAGYSVLANVDEESAKQLQALVKKYANDPRPAVKSMIGSYQLELQAQNFLQFSSEQRKQYVDRLFAHIDASGLDQKTLTIANNLSELTEQMGDFEIGATINEKMATVLEKMKRPEIQPQIDRLKAVARRLRLPGNAIKIIGEPVGGGDFDWKSYRGKIVLVDFWASWCGPCRAEIPNVKKMLELYPDDFAVVGINLDDTEEQCQKFVKDQELPWVNLMSSDEAKRGWDNPMAAYYGIGGIPTAILVDREGKVVSMEARGEDLQLMLKQMIGE